MLGVEQLVDRYTGEHLGDVEVYCEECAYGMLPTDETVADYLADPEGLATVDRTLGDAVTEADCDITQLARRAMVELVRSEIERTWSTH